MKILYGLLLALSVSAFSEKQINSAIRTDSKTKGRRASTSSIDTATFASGCFWCGEAKFSQLKGVLKVTSGYTGGHVADPGYELVCTGTTGHFLS